MRQRTGILAATALLAAACTTSPEGTSPEPAPTLPGPTTTTSIPPGTTGPASVPETVTAPPTPNGPLEQELGENLEALVSSLASSIDQMAIENIGRSGDPRAAWVLTDLLRFVQFGEVADSATAAFGRLTGVDLDPAAPGAGWVDAANLLMKWDVPAPPGYFDYKRRIYLLADPRWEPFFDEEAVIDWRYVSWGGVYIDDRPLGDGSRCERSCIPALDQPAVTPASEGDWYPDNAIVFGVVVGDEARAYPKNMMEIHEMVNDTLGGRKLGIPYCTLCGSAQAYLTDAVPESVAHPLLRTSGLLVRSNKMMFDLNTYSLIDTFRGTAVSGPLAAEAVQLEQVSVVTSTWGAWKSDHPETTILARDGGIGMTYPDDPLGGRDAGGPIFPIGNVDPRLPVQTQVLGVATPTGDHLAFPADDARAALLDGKDVELAGVRLIADGSGLRAELVEGGELAGHQAFWFAWSQFHPDTLLWSPEFG